MIKEIRSNNPKFQKITFRSGFNVILADREREKADGARKKRE